MALFFFFSILEILKWDDSPPPFILSLKQISYQASCEKINLLIKGFSANNSDFIKEEGFYFFFYKAADNLRIPDLTELYFIFPR